MSATVAQELAELRRANVELMRERDAALAEVQARDALRSSEYGERIAHQAATIDVLKAMSDSPGNPRPVLDMIVQQATNHGWVNRGTEPCRILFVLMDSKEP